MNGFLGLIRKEKMQSHKHLNVLSRAVLVAVVVAIAAAIGAPPGQASAGDLWVTTDTTLTEDHYGQILVRANDVTLDCAGHQIFGPGFAGVDLNSVTGVTVKNCTVSGHKVGFFVWSSPNNTLRNNTASDNEGEGFALASSPNNIGNVLNGNVSSHNGWWGFAVYDNSSDTTLVKNVSTANGFAGFLIALGSDRTKISQNVAQRDTFGGFDIDSDENVVVDNAASDTPGNGFFVFQANDNRFVGNKAERSGGDGFNSTGSEHGNTFAYNLASKNGNDGFHFDNGASENRLNGNVSSANTVHGFGLYSVSNIVSSDDRAQGNGGFGFSLFRTTGSVLTRDLARDNQNGFVGGQSNGNTFSEDVAIKNGFGFILYDGSTGNIVQQSIARTNSVDAADTAPAGANSWMRNSFGTTSLP